MAITTKKLIAEEYVVSSSVTLMTQSFASGSTVFGDSLDDTHRMTGSLFVSGGISTDGSAGGTATFKGTSAQSTLNLQTSVSNFVVGLSNSSGRLDLRPGGSTALTVINSGNVGIGNTSPGAKLTIGGSSSSGLHDIRLENSSAQIKIGVAGGGSDIVSSAVAGDFIISNVTGGTKSILFGIGTSEHMRVDHSGNIGIGQSSPSHPLDVAGVIRTTGTGTNSSVRLNNTTSSTGNEWQLYSYNNGDFSIYETSDRLYIKSNGNIGIGETSPDQKLHIKAATQMRLERASVASYDTLIDNLVTGDTADLTFQAQTSDTGFLFQSKNSSGTQINALAINEAGKVGIGTTNPDASLHISSSVGSSTSSLHIEGSGSSVVAVDGTQGRLFSITDELSGSLFSANTISGLPVIEAFSDNKVTLGPFSKPITVTSTGNISGSATSTGSFGSLVVADKVQGNLVASGNITTGGQILSPGGSNIALNPNTGLVTIANNLQLSGYVQAAGNLVSTGANAKISGSSTSTGSFGNVFVRDEIEITDSNTAICEGNNNSVRLKTNNGYIEIGPQNSTLAHIYTDRNQGFFFNRAIGVHNNKIYVGDFGSEIITIDPDVSGGSPKISGSASSTGSFGKVSVGTANPKFAHLNVEGDIALGTYAANMNRRIGLQRSDGGGWSNTPHITFSTDGGADASIKFSVIDSGVAGYADAVVIDKSGNVGIGETSPSVPLHVSGDGGASDPLATMLLESTSNHGGLVINAPASKQTHLRFQNNGSLKWQIRSPFHDGTNPDSLRIYSWTYGGDVMVFKNDGNVGIGTNNPVQKLHLHGGSMYMQTGQNITWNNGDVQIGAISGFHFRIQTYTGSSLTEKMRVTSGGNVGINTSSPSAKLHVSGAASTTATLIEGRTNGNVPILHIKDKADMFVAMFEGQRAGDTGAVVSIYHNPTTSQETNRTMLNFQMNDDGDNRTTYAQLFSGIDDHTDGTEDGNLQIKTVENGTLTEQMTINSTGVGIGETSPSFPLDVVKSANTGDPLTQATAYQLGIRNSNGNSGAATSIAFGHETFDFSAFISALRTSSGNHPTADLTFGARPSDNATFVERMRIVGASGNVGIGENSPSAKLQIKGGGITVSGSNDTSPIQAMLIKTSAASSQGLIGVEGNTAGAFITGTVARAMVVASSASGTALQLGAAGSVGLTMLSNGDIGINDTSPSFKLDVNGTGRFTGNVALSGDNAQLSIGHTGETHWGTGFDILEVGHSMALFCETADGADRNAFVANNLYADGDGLKRHYTDQTVSILLRAGFIAFRTDASGTAGAVFTPSERMRITEDGNVGIGTTSPVGLLTLYDPASGDNKLRFQNSTTGVTTSDGSRIGLNGAELFINNIESSNIKIYTGSTQTQGITIDSSGKVGIGITSPTGKLQVAGDIVIAQGSKLKEPDGNAYISFDSSYHITGSSAGDIVFDIDNNGNETNSFLRITKDNQATELMRVQENGNVGIGTNNPDVKFHVFDSSALSVEFESSTGNVDLTINSGTDGAVEKSSILLQANSSNKWEILKTTSDNFQIYDYGRSAGVLDIISNGNMGLMADGGNVGIGTTSPDTKLHLADSSDVYLTLESTHASTPEEAAIKYSNSSTSANYWWAGLNQSDDYSLAYGTSFSGANTRFLVTETGNVGIGVTDPDSALEVKSSDDTFLKVSTGNDTFHARIKASISNDTPMQMTGISGHAWMKQRGGDGEVTFLTNGGNERMRIDGSGNVGIGTTNPGATLDILGPSDGVNLRLSDVAGNSTTKEARIGVRHYTEAEEDTALMYAQSGNGTSAVYIGGGTGVMNAVELIGFVTAATDTTLSGTTRMVIDSGGKVGINHDSPSAVLEVKGQTGVSSTALITHGLVQMKTTHNDSSELRHQFSMGGASDPGSYNIYQGNASTIGVHLDAGDDSFFLNSVGIGGAPGHTGLDVSAGHISVDTAFSIKLDGPTGGDSISSPSSNTLQFMTGGAKRLIINNTQISGSQHSTGSFGVVRAGNGGPHDPSYQFGGNSDGFFHDISAPGEGIKLMVNNANEALFANGGDFHADGDVISNSSTISDSVFKTDVTTISSAVNKVKQLRGVSFKWLKGKRSGSADLGVIAQEVEPVLPEIVKTRPLPLWQDKDPEISGSFKTVDYEKLTAVLIESVKEQQTKLEQLEAEIEKLKGG
tara:strand:- start:4421 stop:10948 length:6528 start_codon:yes stop_codon:yes gene_type:complete